MKITMKYILSAVLLLVVGVNLYGQTIVESKEGTVSFVTSQNVYVKFQSTDNISIGDTLFIIEDTNWVPVLVVKDLSSISCVCTSISAKTPAVSDKILTWPKIAKPEKNPEIFFTPVPEITPVADTGIIKKETPQEIKQDISGRVSVSSYSNFSNMSDFSQRMRYTFSMSARNLAGSKLSAETYISFVHKLNEWSDVKQNIYNGLKIYSLSLNYALNKNNAIWFGRKINPRLSNAGAIDGVQYETKFKTLTAGIFAGTRPDYLDYSFNASLLQYGAYLSHDHASAKGTMQNSIAFVEQKNNGYMDRRFAYFQHSNALLTNLNLFGSVEFDLFNKKLNIQDSTYKQDNSPKLSNLYVSLRYRVIKQLTLSLSYSNRQNIVYYETYKSIIDQLLEASAMHGYTLQANYRPGKKITVGANAGYRFSKQDPKPSKNLYSYVTYSDVPWINASATLSATLMETSYINGNIYSLGFSRDILPGKLSGGIGYRYVKYKFVHAETPLVQHMAEMDMTWRIMKKLSFSLNYEGTFEKGRNYERIYINLTQRF